MNSTDDLIQFTCRTDYNVVFDISKFVITLIYLGIGLFLHLSILKVVIFKENKIYKDNSFMMLFATDSVASSILILVEIGFHRFFLYISPLCPIIGPYFWSPSSILRVVYVIQNHMRFAKSVSQIFMVLNRMTCVLTPSGYHKIWKKLNYLAYFLVICLPIAGTWNIAISRIYLQAVYSGFAINYIRYVKWAALSLFHSIFILTALVFTVICTLITLFNLFLLPNRIKTAEKSLCITSFSISITFLMVAGTQIIFAISCQTCRGDFSFVLQFLAFDVFTVGSAVIMIITNTPFRNSIFFEKSGKIVERKITPISLHITSMS